MLIGVVGVLSALGVANNLYVQIGLVLLIALSSKNAILIVEYARDLRLKQGVAIEEAAIEAARRRFRPIVMTSFAFILGVVPLVLATGAGASARKSIGITVFSGMLASTCIAILFVPSFFVLLQRYERAARAAQAPDRAGGHRAPGLASARSPSRTRERGTRQAQPECVNPPDLPRRGAPGYNI